MNATVLTVWLLLSSDAESTALTPEKVAQIHADQAKAHAAIDKKYGEKKLSELTTEERQAREKERSAASLHVFEQAGTDDKTFSRYEATLSREQRSRVKAAEDKLKATPEEPRQPEIIDGVEEGPEIVGAEPAIVATKAEKKSKAASKKAKKRHKK
ncbi:MAG: hypothetical protein K1X64_07035 [Myxococcaceae bacterium]|nr:hypothetical protein [Myxococcaceae bacterium]